MNSTASSLETCSPHKLQSNNIDAGLAARGATAGSSLVSQYDVNGYLGGRIVEDKLWFFISERQYKREFNVPGYTGTNKVRSPDHAFKVTYQPSKNYRLIGFQEQSVKRELARSASAFIPFASTYDYTFPPFVRKLELSGSPSDRMLFNATVGRYSYAATYDPQESSEASGLPRTSDIRTLQQTGSAIQTRQEKSLWSYAASLSLFPESFLGGKHEFKFGYQMQRRTDTISTRDQLGNYILIFNNGQPFQIQLENRPASEAGTVDHPAVFVTDTWRWGNLTANLGARWERYMPSRPHCLPQRGSTSPAPPRRASTSSPGTNSFLGLAWRGICGGTANRS